MAKLKYYFPLDNVIKNGIVTSDENNESDKDNSSKKEQHLIKTRYTTVDIKAIGELDSSFDEYKGSYIELKKEAEITIGFNDVFNSVIENGDVLFNFFIRFENSDSANFLELIPNKVADQELEKKTDQESQKENDALKIKKDNGSYSLVFIEQKRGNTKESGVRKNTWYNCTLHLKKDQIVDLYITDEKQLISKEPIISTKINTKIFSLLFGANKNEQSVKIADLSIFENVAQDEVISTINSLIETHLVLLSKSTMLENVDFNLFNDDDSNSLILQNEVVPIKFEFNLGDFQIKDDENRNKIRGILRVKKGFLKNTSNDLNENDDSNENNDEISFTIDPNINENKLSAIFNNIEILNLLELERVLFQLEIYNLTLVKDDDNFEENFTKNNPLIIDKTFDVIDNRGKNICPFDVFVFGNDTLYNGDDNTSQLININIINVLEIPVELNSKSKFSLSSPYINDILKKDSLSTTEVQITSENVLLGLSKYERSKFNCQVFNRLKLANDFTDLDSVEINYDSEKLNKAFYKGIFNEEIAVGNNLESCLNKYIFKEILNLNNWENISIKLNEVKQNSFYSKKIDHLIKDIADEKNFIKLTNCIKEVANSLNNNLYIEKYRKIKDELVVESKEKQLFGDITNLLLNSIIYRYYSDENFSAKNISIRLSNIKVNNTGINNPSGSYPFYLEYRNIPGYRNGKVKFFIKTGRVYYSN
ncbi:hypothetical protein [Empedobacter tilapiae]|uniref:Uncharacterized protein n=1 Tax=Empedobacter tilapiae TaxID=2491114 RepID=A0A4Z1BBM2_9FLAO|nr:hypothetical protein [Empedobacter tilapiae]TGN22520.1 hypothetical protein E4J94_15860 [Empedobacter tilapiae]